MRRHFLTRIAMLGPLLALAACDDADTIEGNDTNELVTASTEYSAPEAEPDNGKASIFGVPREAQVLLLSR
jgi:hypothetical protein